MKKTNDKANNVADDVASEIDEEATELGDKGHLGSTIHEYHYLLAREFKMVMKHLNESPPRRYSFKEWAWFLKLMGEDEDSPNTHRKPTSKPEHDPDGGTDLQQAKPQDDELDEGAGWSWLGERSPLMGEMAEAEWVLERLAGKLEMCLKESHKKEKCKAEGNAGEPKEGG